MKVAVVFVCFVAAVMSQQIPDWNECAKDPQKCFSGYVPGNGQMPEVPEFPYPGGSGSGGESGFPGMPTMPSFPYPGNGASGGGAGGSAGGSTGGK